MRRAQWEVPDPLLNRIKERLARVFICSIIGHSKVVKMDGTELCHRHR